jgi:hypothetical protein
MKKYLLVVVLVLAALLTQFGFASAQGGTPPSLTSDEIKNAILIADPNIRPLVLDAGESALYHVDGTELYIKVANQSIPENQSSVLPTAAIWTTTQVCGVNAYVNGLLVAVLVNRANITYYTSTAKTPAKFNWYDLRGTKTNAVGFYWTGLSQTSYPGIGVKFNSSGWVQAQGTLNRCLAGVCGPQGYFVSYLRVTTSGTRCQ